MYICQDLENTIYSIRYKKGVCEYNQVQRGHTLFACPSEQNTSATAPQGRTYSLDRALGALTVPHTLKDVSVHVI